MFSEEWDLKQLDQRAQQIVDPWTEQETFLWLSLLETHHVLASSNWDRAKEWVVLASGYPEAAGAWSYTLLENSEAGSDDYSSTTMAPYFEVIPNGERALIVLTPNQPARPQNPEAATAAYLEQLEALFEKASKSQNFQKCVFLGFSLGGSVLLDFLQQFPEACDSVSGMVLLDPAPPKVGRRRMHESLQNLLSKTKLYGLGRDGIPGEFAESAKMRLKVSPELVDVASHGALPNAVLPEVQEAINLFFNES